MDDLYIEDDGEVLGEIRSMSAYSGLRFLINLFLGISIVGSIAGPAYYLLELKRLIPITLEFILLMIGIALVNVLLAFIVRGLALALLDIADVQLRQTERNRRRKS